MRPAQWPWAQPLSFSSSLLLDLKHADVDSFCRSQCSGLPAFPNAAAYSAFLAAYMVDRVDTVETGVGSGTDYSCNGRESDVLCDLEFKCLIHVNMQQTKLF